VEWVWWGQQGRRKGGQCLGPTYQTLAVHQQLAKDLAIQTNGSTNFESSGKRGKKRPSVKNITGRTEQ
jgi:hypothetical protein